MTTQQRAESILKMMNSDRPNTQMCGSLQAIGCLQEAGELRGLQARFEVWFTKLTAKLMGWTNDQIEEELEHGRVLHRLEVEEDNAAICSTN